MVGSKQAVRGFAIWYNTAMLFLLAAAIIMTATTGTCLAQTDLSDNSLPLITSYDIYGTNYIDKAIRFGGRVMDVFKDESRPAASHPALLQQHRHQAALHATAIPRHTS